MVITYYFMTGFKQFGVPVVAIRRMSRFRPDVRLIKQAWGANISSIKPLKR
jgi:hypothetical protein